MNFLSQDMLKQVETIAKEDRFSFFFDNMSKDKMGESISKDEKDLLDKLTEMFIKEFNLNHDDAYKVGFMMRLGYWSKK